MLTKIRSKLKSKTGAAIVYVIVAATILTMIGTTGIMVAYTQLAKQKLMNKSQNNFYSAEIIMNAITTGLEQDVATAYDDFFLCCTAFFTLYLKS